MDNIYPNYECYRTNPIMGNVMNWKSLAMEDNPWILKKMARSDIVSIQSLESMGDYRRKSCYNAERRERFTRLSLFFWREDILYIT